MAQYIINLLFRWILENITRLIGRIYARATGTRVNTKPTDATRYSPVSDECVFTSVRELVVYVGNVRRCECKRGYVYVCYVWCVCVCMCAVLQS